MAVATAVRERLVLNPGPGELDLNRGPIRVAVEGPDWGEAAIEQATADAARGTIPVDYRLPNRQIQIPLIIGADGPRGFADARQALQAHVGRIQTYGGVLWRGGGEHPALSADLIDATLKLPERWAFLQGIEIDVTLGLSAIPDFYGAEVSRPVRVSTGAEAIFAEHGIRGDYPGRVRIVVTDREGEVKNGLLWGIRSRYYDSSSTARLFYLANELESLGTTAGAAWTPLLALAPTGGENLTHTGTYRVWVRASATAGAQLQLAWGLADISAPLFNTPVTFPGTGATSYYLLDLGEIRLDPAPLGRHHWRAEVRGIRTTSSNATVAITVVYLQPVAELAGRVWVPPGRPAVTTDPDAVIPANATCELRTDGIWREETHGLHPPGVESGYLPASHVTGDLPRIFPGSNEVFVRVSRGDHYQQLDPQLNEGAFDAHIFYRPSYLNPLPPITILSPVITSPVHESRIQTDTPPIVGTGQPGNTIEAFLNDQSIGTTTVDPSGAWSFTLPGPLPFARHVITAVQIDSAENISEPISVVFTVQIWSWQEVTMAYTTWNALKADFATWDATVRRGT